MDRMLYVTGLSALWIALVVGTSVAGLVYSPVLGGFAAGLVVSAVMVHQVLQNVTKARLEDINENIASVQDEEKR